MSLRLIEIHHKEGKAEEIDFLVKDMPLLETWHDYLASGGSIITILIKNTMFYCVLTKGTVRIPDPSASIKYV